MRRVAFAAAVVWLAASACSLNPAASSSTATSARLSPVGSPLAAAAGALDAEVAMPPGFPADFPIYPRSRLTAAVAFASAGQTAWGMEWESLDGTARVQVAFPKQFSSTWVLAVNTNATNGFSATISRKNDSRVTGMLAIVNVGALTKILVSLVARG